MSTATANAASTSAGAQSAATTDRSHLDQAIAVLAERAKEFARLPPAAKAQLLRACIPRLVDLAPEWVATGAHAKALPAELSAEEWLAGPMTTVRMMRLLAESLEEITRLGKPAFGRGARTRPDGRVEVDIFPSSHLDKVTWNGFRGYVLMQKGIDRAEARKRQASFYDKRDPEGGVALVLGAGNVSSIPPMDAFTKMFIEGYVCLVKMNPVNEWVGPILERALAPMIERGYLRIVYGGGDVGKYLCEHKSIADVHITGSDATHDLIVWGPPGPEREKRKKANDPLLKVPISSELGNVSPVAIVPGLYSEEELVFQAKNVATMITNNASFNCNAAKMLITSAKWPQRERFLDLVKKCLAEVKPRKAYYPGAHDRYAKLTAGRARVEKIGAAGPDALPWTIIRDVDSAKTDDPLFRTEPFCGLLSETTLPAGDAAEFLGQATKFMNDTLWGTLNACIVIHPRDEARGDVATALDRAIVELRYGTVAINHWPAIVYGSVTLPWGGHPSATLGDIQSGLGWVHNTYMMEGMDKTVVRGPLLVKPTPAWFYDNKNTRALGPKLVAMESDPSWLRLPGIVLGALKP
jgi:acyl-CoA reductase-like NAD-dependent aldehyde dehydrogenase